MGAPTRAQISATVATMQAMRILQVGLWHVWRLVLHSKNVTWVTWGPAPAGETTTTIPGLPDAGAQL